MTQETTTLSDTVKGAILEGVKNKDKKDKSVRPTKVVVRRLPPTMTKETFEEQVSPLPDHDHMYFVKADMSWGQFAFSRAYINIVNQEDLFAFKETFDGYVFVDEKGNEYPAIVEFSPYQKYPRGKGKKRDPKCGTIESDPDYIKFLESLEAEDDVKLPSKEICLEEIEARERELENNRKLTTPLLEYLKQRKAEKQRMREEKREERKRRELERKKQREEDRKRKREQKEREKRDVKEKKEYKKEIKESKDKDEETQPVVKLLKNPEREKAKESKTAEGESSFEKSEDKVKGEGKDKYRSDKETTRKQIEKDRQRKRDEERQRYKEKQRLDEKMKDKRDKEGNSSKKLPKDDRSKPQESRPKRYTEGRREERLRAAEARERQAEDKREDKTSETNKGEGSKTASEVQKEMSDNNEDGAVDDRTEASKSDDQVLKDSSAEDEKSKDDSDRQVSEHSKEKESKGREMRAERRIRNKVGMMSAAEGKLRNKDRPSMEIYRPGMGKFSMQKKEKEKDCGSSKGGSGDMTEAISPSTTPSPTASATIQKDGEGDEKKVKKKESYRSGKREGDEQKWKEGGGGGRSWRRDYEERRSYRIKSAAGRDEEFRKEKSPKEEIEVRSMTFKRSVSREK